MGPPSIKSKGISRRKFVNLGIQGYAGIGLSQLPSGTLLMSQACNTSQAKTVHGACYHDCPDTCSWTVTAVNNQITRFEGSQSNPFTAGNLCDKMKQFPDDVTFHPDRILSPLKRTGKKGNGEFEPISWDQAISEISNKLKTIIAEKGGTAILPYSFAGTQGLIQGNAISNRFFAHIGSTKLERTICGNAAAAGVMTTNGQTTGVLPEDIVHSRYIILWGTNTVNSNQHLWPYILKARIAGAKIIVVDPFQSQTSILADRHIQPLSGTDTALALGMIHIILSEHLHDQEYVDQYTAGIEELKNHVATYDPMHVAGITGLTEDTIVQLAKEYANGSPSLIRVLIGMEHHANGGNAFRTVAMLPALTGAWKQLGGGLMHFTYEPFGEALNWERLNLVYSIEKPTRSVNMVQIGRALNDPSLNPGIDALFVYNSNPAVIAPNQNLVIKGLEREDLTTVVLEHFITDTARYADYVLPATSQLEHWDLMNSWGQVFLNLNQPVIPPLGKAKPNTEIFRLLSREMGFEEDYLFESDLDIIKKTLESDHPYLDGITFESLKKTGWSRLKLPDPWMPHAKGNFKTPSGKCEFYSPSNAAPLPEYTPVKYTDKDLRNYPLQLLTLKSTRSFLNTSHANVGHLRKKEGDPVLDIHPSDAMARDIKDGDKVRVSNQQGEVIITARIRQKVRNGVVCLPQGFWPSLMEGGSSANALTSDLLTDMGRGSAMQEARVEVSRLSS